MSLKSIELQVALPRTKDIGQVQNNLHQRGNVEQSFLMSQHKKLELEKRKKTEKLIKSDLNEQNTTRKPKPKETDPNRGKFVDLSL